MAKKEYSEMHIPLFYFVPCIGRPQRRLCSQGMLHSGQLTQICLAKSLSSGLFARKPQVKGDHQRLKRLSSCLAILQTERSVTENHSIPGIPGLSRPRVCVDWAGGFSVVVSLPDQLHLQPRCLPLSANNHWTQLACPYKKTQVTSITDVFETSKVASLKNEGVGKLCLLIDLGKGRC